MTWPYIIYNWYIFDQYVSGLAVYYNTLWENTVQTDACFHRISSENIPRVPKTIWPDMRLTLFDWPSFDYFIIYSFNYLPILFSRSFQTFELIFLIYHRSKKYTVDGAPYNTYMYTQYTGYNGQNWLYNDKNVMTEILKNFPFI